MQHPTTKAPESSRPVHRLGLRDLPADGWGRTPHWLFHGILATIVHRYGRGAGLVWIAVCHAIEGHHAKKARVSIRELASATGLSRTGVERALRRLRAGGELTVVERYPGKTFVYQARPRTLAGGEDVSH